MVGLFGLSMIFHDLGNMVFRTVFYFFVCSVYSFIFRLKVSEKSAAISCRAVRSKNDHNEAQIIYKTRYLLEEQIGQISEIQFFMSCVTITTTTTKTSSNTARPGIAYFIVFRKNSKANETVLFSCLLDIGMNASVTRTSSNKKSLDEECAMIQGLKQVVKVIKFVFYYFKKIRGRFANLSGKKYQP